MQDEKQKQELDPAWYISARKAGGSHLGSAETRADGINPVVGPIGKSFLDKVSSKGSLRRGEMCLGWGGHTSGCKNGPAGLCGLTSLLRAKRWSSINPHISPRGRYYHPIL